VHNHLRNAVHVAEQSFSRWTFGELKRHVDAFANGLLSLRFAPGDKLALALPNNAEMLVATLAAAKVGVVIVPLGRSPSEELIKSTLSDGAKGLIFADVVGQTNYVDLVSRIVPETKDFGSSEFSGLPFQSLTFPATKYLINTGRNRAAGMLRYQWVPVYSFDDGIRRNSGKVSGTSALFQDPSTKKVTTHADILTRASVVAGTSGLSASSIFAIGASLSNPAAFAAGYAAAHVNGSMAVLSQENDTHSFDMFFQVIKPNVFVADQSALTAIADLKPAQPVSHLILVGACDDASVQKAKAALGATIVVPV